MKFFVGLILCVAYVNCETFTECSGKPSRTFVSGGEKNCRSFIYCDGENSFKDTCPIGLAFNKVDLTCDDPENVECDSNDDDDDEMKSVATTKKPIISSKKPAITATPKLPPTPPGKPLKKTPKPSPIATTLKGNPNRPVPGGPPIRTKSPSKLTSLILPTTTRKSSPNQPPVPTKNPSGGLRTSTQNPARTPDSGIRIPTPPGAKYDPNQSVPSIITNSPKETGPTWLPTDRTSYVSSTKSHSTTKAPKSTMNPQSEVEPSARELCIKQSVGNFAYPDDCHSYYSCRKGVLTKLGCPKGFGWDDRYKICSSKVCLD